MDFSGGDEPCGRGLGDAEVSRWENDSHRSRRYRELICNWGGMA
jgi:hypothetical protein